MYCEIRIMNGVKERILFIFLCRYKNWHTPWWIWIVSCLEYWKGIMNCLVSNMKQELITYYCMLSMCVCVCVCVCVCMRVCVCLCMYGVCVLWGSIAKQSEHQPANRKVAGLIPARDPLVSFCFIEQETLLTLLQFTQPYKWGPGVNWRNSPPSCNINRYLLITGKANAQLSLSCLAMWSCCGSLDSAIFIRQSPPAGYYPCPRRICPSVRMVQGISVMVHWAAIAV